MFGHLSNAGRKKLGLTAEWTAFRYEGIGQHDSILTFAVPVALKSGPNKGQRKWPKPHHKVAVTRAELENEQRTYEATTGHCWKCCGKGQEVAGVSAKDGTRWKTCQRCAGSGRAA